MNNSTFPLVAHTGPTAAPSAPSSRDELLATPAWIVQYDPTHAARLREDWEAASDEDRDDFVVVPPVGRHRDEIRLGDFVLFWVYGPGDSAGLYAWGNAGHGPVEDEYPQDWKKPEGPKVRKPGWPVDITDVLPTLLVPRSTLQRFPEFDDFELFTMPNRASAFAVTPAQWSVLLDYITGRRTSDS